MGNTQPKEVNLINQFIDEQKTFVNSSECEEIYRAINDDNVSTSDFNQFMVDMDNYTGAYLKCFNHSIPRNIVNQPYILPWYQQVLWTLVFSVMIMVAVVGNIIVMWIILAHRRMRTVTNLFLLNLAVADFLLASGNATFNFIYMLNSHWPFGATFCVVSNFLAALTVSTSVFTILAMSIDRFVAVTRPLRPKMTKTVACSIILTVWTVSCLLSLPALLHATTITYRYGDDSYRIVCMLVWPDYEVGGSYIDLIYNITFMIVTYVVPMSCMAVTYTWIGCILWGSKVIGENSDPQNHVIKSKQRAVHMLIAIMSLFGICWLPYHVYFLYTYYNSNIVYMHYIQHVYLAIYWLAMSNSCYNPIVYYIMNARFRSYFQVLMCVHKFSSKPFEGTALGETARSIPLHAKTSIVTSQRTRSYRMSHLRYKRDCEYENGQKIPNNHEAEI